MLFIYLLAIFGVTFAIKEADGPWGIMSFIRNKLMTAPYIGSFFYNLLACWFCTGCWAGAAIYMITGESIKLGLGAIWALTGGAASLILGTLWERLLRD